MRSAPRVLIADDHAPTRVGVRMALEQNGFEVCAEAATAAEAVDAALRERPDACILDVRMPGGGTSAASMITTRLPETVVLMLTVSRDDDDLLESLRRGAVGYLLKDMDPAALSVALRAALAGEATLPRALALRVIEELRQAPRRRKLPAERRPGSELTKREWEVLDLLREGADTAEIAERLFLSQVTVRRHVSNILGKLHAASREDVVRLVSDADFPDIDGAGTESGG
jgi:DNA-binding NarL/FixJ family response regulator